MLAARTVLASVLLSGTMLASTNATGQTVPVYNQAGEIACERKDDAPALNRNGYAVIIGNRNYSKGRVPEVAFAHNDAAAICDFVVNRLGYPPEQVYVLYDLDNIDLPEWFAPPSGADSRLRRLTRAVGSDLELVVYYSGHGAPVGEQAVLVPSNVSVSSLTTYGFRIADLTDALANLDAKRILLLLEACFSGQTASADGAKTYLPETSYFVEGAEIETEEPALTVLSAAGPDEVANWDSTRQLGLFTAEFLASTDGRANRDGDAVITMAELVRDVGQTVANRSMRLVPGQTDLQQTPGYSGNLDDWRFPVTAAPARQPTPTPEPQVAALPPESVAIEPEPAPVDAVDISRAEWRQIQRALTSLDYAVGGADGLPGQRTRGGIEAWQADKGFKVSGYLGEEQVLALLEVAREIEDVPVRRQAEDAVGVFERHEVGDRFQDCSNCPDMVVVPSGSFMMGSPPGEGYDRERPQHRVTIAEPFAVGVFEVTFAEWDACVAARGCSHRPEDAWGRGRQPVINVSWNDAQEYVQWLSRETGEAYRLLSEAQWEYVARAGTTTAYHFGASFSSSKANNGDGTVTVGSYRANAFGLHDVHGNVWEWVEDRWHDSYSGAPLDGSAWTSGNDSRRVLRGGSWDYIPRYLRSADRNGNTAGDRNNDLGFRVARTL